MAVSLLQAYAGQPAGNVACFTTEVENALIAQNRAQSSTRANVTTGAITQNTTQGTAAIPAGSSSVVVTNSLVDANSHVFAVVAQAAADGTLLRVERVVCAAGSFTIYGTANATATTLIDWTVINQAGQTQRL